MTARAWLLAKYKVIMKRPCKGQILAKVKGIYCNKVCCFAGLVKSVGIISDDNSLWSHRTSTQQKQTKKSTYSKVFSDKTLFATVPRQSTIHATVPPWQNFQRMRLLSAKAKCNYQMTTTSCPDRKHLLLEISKLNNASQVYIRRYKSKQKAELVRAN